MNMLRGINQRIVGHPLQSLSNQTQYYFRSKFYILKMMQNLKENVCL